MLSVIHRFHGHGSLRFVYKNGQSVRSRFMTIKYNPNPKRKHSRVAVIVSKKVLKRAVGRNRIRRRLYEVVRGELTAINVPHDIAIIVVSSEVISLPHQELVDLMRGLFTEAELYKKS